MRILRVRFQNLNSLWGEWEIDFTAPAYVAEGIFAITGPTGAGKTTILDAICLALYGRTPRLRDLTQSTNEIMSRQAGECFAEVVFETNSGTYRAHWSQHRAHRQPDGALQQPRHELADAESGELLESRQRNMEKKVEEVTGLTFDQFSRSILLAQGHFAAFLQSGANERSSILEQITGTEIYSQISMRVHENRGNERIKLKELESGLSALKVLEANELAEQENALEKHLKDETELEGEETRLKNELDWLGELTARQTELDGEEGKSRELAVREESFAPDLERLSRAQRALELGSAYASLVALRKEQDNEQKTLSGLQTRLPELEAELRRAEESVQLADSSLTEKKTEQRNAADLFRRVRELDLRRKEKELPLLECQAAVEQFEKALADLTSQYEASRDLLEKSQVRIRDVQKFLQTNAADEKLVEQLASIRTRFESLVNELGKKNALKEKCAAAEQRKQKTQSVWNELDSQYEATKARFSQLEGNTRKLKTGLDEVLEKKSLPEWREILTAGTERLQLARKVEEMLERRAELHANREELNKRLAELETNKKSNSAKIADKQNACRALEKEIEQLEIQNELLRRIRDLEEARHQLRDDQPCPLCGSLEHPYAAGNIPSQDEVHIATRTAKDDLRKLLDEISALKIEEAQNDQESIRIADDETRNRAEAQILEDRLAEGLAELQLKVALGGDPLAEMKRHRQIIEESLQKKRDTVERAEKIEQEMLAAREDTEKMRTNLETAALAQQEALFSKENAARESDRLLQEARIQEEELKSIRADLTQKVAPFGYRDLPDERPEELLKSLEMRQFKWQEHYRLRLELEKQISASERDLQHARDSVEKQRLELKEKQETCKKLLAEQEALRQQRAALFDDNDPDEAEIKIAQGVEEAERLVEERRSARAETQLEFSNMHSRMEELIKTLHTRKHTLQKTDLAFGKLLAENDFKNEDLYIASCLPEEERRKLQERAQALSSERAEIDARRTDKKFALEELRRLHLTDRSIEVVREEKDVVSLRLKEMRQTIGALRQRLKDNEEALSQRAERQNVLENQQEELLRWEELHDLIGSADGQKYRNFAQGLTFDMVVGHANEQLRKMTDRYLLVRDGDQTLNLKVVDSYQAGEVRSTQNLSGGESFIVSLALALGLSHMASRKVRMDSLFLDEGFGTLDEDALDMALSTLAGLRREGKLIGVISHVDALKERIATQIEVIPQGNGRSVIRAPGCSQSERRL